MSAPLPILDAIAAKRSEALERLKLKAASGAHGCRDARAQMVRLRTEELREAVRS